MNRSANRVAPMHRSRLVVAIFILAASTTLLLWLLLADTGSLLPGLPSVARALESQNPGTEQAGLDSQALAGAALDSQLEASWRQGDWTRACDLLERELAARPQDNTIRGRLSTARCSEAWRLLHDNHPTEARARFEDALRLDPASPEARAGLDMLKQSVGGGGPVVVTIPAEQTPVAPAPQPSQAQQVPLCPTPCPPVSAPTCVPTSVPVCPPSVVCVPPCATTSPPCIPCVPVCLPPRPPCCSCVLACAVVSVAPCPVACAPLCFLPAPAVSTTAAVTGPQPLRFHVVQKGDTLFRLAIQLNTSVQVLMQLNGLTSTTIKVGQVLVIP